MQRRYIRHERYRHRELIVTAPTLLRAGNYNATIDRLIPDSSVPENVMNYDHSPGEISSTANLKSAEKNNTDTPPSSLNRDSSSLYARHTPKATSTSADEVHIKDPHRHRVLHNLVERRHRENLKHKFQRLENILNYRHGRTDHSRTTKENGWKRMRRATILEYACADIRALLSAVRSLEQKLKMLRQAACSDAQTAI